MTKAGLSMIFLIKDIFSDSDIPVTGIDILCMQAYCEFLNLFSYPRPLRFRMPTEEEWTLIASGPNKERMYPWEDDPPDKSKALYHGALNHPCDPSWHYKGKTPDGVYGLTGNVFEMTADGYLKGGCYASRPDELKNECKYDPVNTSLRFIGFRVVAEIK